MALLSEIIDRTTGALYRAGDALDEISSVIDRWRPRRRLDQPYDALLKGVLWLAAIVTMDRLAGHPPILQLLYLAPVWIAFETAGIGAAAFLAAMVVPISTAFSKEAIWGLGWDLIVRSGFMTSLVVIMTFHSRRYRTTHESARRDSLTGALNRAGFESTVRETIDAVLEAHETLTFAVIDCDNFKDLNDAKGHAFGDTVLKTLVRTLATSLPDSILGRTGGDEFVIVDSTRTPDAVRAALRIALNRFTDATLILGRRATFTVGIASLGPDGMRYESLLEAADRDMYRGKFERYSDNAELERMSIGSGTV